MQSDFEKGERMWQVAGWTPCCRCYPSAVHDDGFCGCCLYNHTTGEQLNAPDPDYDFVWVDSEEMP